MQSSKRKTEEYDTSLQMQRGYNHQQKKNALFKLQVSIGTTVDGYIPAVKTFESEIRKMSNSH